MTTNLKQCQSCDQIAALNNELQALNSDLRALNSELTAQKEMLDSIISGAQDGILVLDEMRRIQVFSPGCERITGWKAAEVIGLPCFERMQCRYEGHPVNCSVSSCPAVDLLESGQVAPYMDITIVRRDGRERWVGLSAAAIRGASRTGDKIVMVWRDVTAAKEMDQMKSTIISAVSHEVKTPVTSIRALSELLAEHDFSPVETKELAAKINSESVRLGDFIEGMLNVARIESGRMRCQVKPIDLAVALRDSVEYFRAQNPGRPFEIDVPPSLPPVSADPELLRLILDNLLSNAAKYSPQESHVVVAARSRRDAIEVRVRDQGFGIPTAEIPHLFEKFYRLTSSDVRRMGGIGLGLFIVRSLVDMHGGTVTVESEQDKGSTFIFTLPLAKAEPEQVPTQ